MAGLNLDDLGIAPATPSRPTPPRPEPGTTTLREAALASPILQDTIASLGLIEATAVLRAAIHQIWSKRPDRKPVVAALMSAAVEDVTHIEALATTLGLRLPERVAARILELTRRRAQAFLDAHLYWQGRLADEGVGREEMDRRASLGEFDASGPLDSRFDLTTMTFLG